LLGQRWLRGKARKHKCHGTENCEETAIFARNDLHGCFLSARRMKEE
jgi:hypothetical protein